MEVTELKRRVSESKINKVLLRKAGLQAFFVLSGFLLGKVSFDGQIFPFGIAFVGGASEEYLLSACLGTALSSLLFSPHLSALKYISAVIILFFLRTGLSKKAKPGSQLWLFPVLTFLTLLISSSALFLIELPDTSELVLELCDSVIAGACSLFSHRLFSLVSDEGISPVVNSGDSASIMLWGALFLLSLDGFFLTGFSPARLLTFLCIMLFAYCGKESSGTMFGVCAGAVFGLSENSPHLLFALPLGGLVCGLSSEYGKIAVSTGFAVSGTLALIIKGNPDYAMTAGIELLSASLIFALLPKKLLSKFEGVFLPLSNEGNFGEMTKLINMKMKRSAGAVRDVAGSVEAVCRTLSRTDRPDVHTIPDDVKEDLCSDCLKKDFCWERYGKITATAFSQCLAALGDCGRLTVENIPERLNVVCREKNALCDSFNRYFCEHNARMTVRNEIFETKSLAAAQFCSAADIMEDALTGAMSPLDTDSRLACLFASVFRGEGFDCVSLTVTGVKAGRAVAEVLLSRMPRNPDYNTLIGQLEAKSGITFMPPVSQTLKTGEILLSFCEKTAIGVKYHKVSRTGEGEKHCGDCCEAFPDGRGHFYCVLSDGMGTGSRAALDSHMTCSLFSKLMKAGFSTDTAFSAVNSALAVKSADESLATLDCFRLDLYSGEGRIYKAGGTFSVVLKSGNVSIIEQASMPLGILKETRFEKTEFTLQKGDGIIVLSDGAQCLKPAFFRELFARSESRDPKIICDKIVAAAVNASPSGKIDDITAACVMLV